MNGSRFRHPGVHGHSAADWVVFAPFWDEKNPASEGMKGGSKTKRGLCLRVYRESQLDILSQLLMSGVGSIATYLCVTYQPTPLPWLGCRGPLHLAWLFGMAVTVILWRNEWPSLGQILSKGLTRYIDCAPYKFLLGRDNDPFARKGTICQGGLSLCLAAQK